MLEFRLMEAIQNRPLVQRGHSASIGERVVAVIDGNCGVIGCVVEVRSRRFYKIDIELQRGPVCVHQNDGERNSVWIHSGEIVEVLKT